MRGQQIDARQVAGGLERGFGPQLVACLKVAYVSDTIGVTWNIGSCTEYFGRSACLWRTDQLSDRTKTATVHPSVCRTVVRINVEERETLR